VLNECSQQKCSANLYFKQVSLQEFLLQWPFFLCQNKCNFVLWILCLKWVPSSFQGKSKDLFYPEPTVFKISFDCLCLNAKKSQFSACLCFLQTLFRAFCIQINHAMIKICFLGFLITLIRNDVVSGKLIHDKYMAVW
jgi:hypothetical protein